MFSWELTLAVRRRICEIRLWKLYDQYGNVVVQRKRHPEMGPSWHKKDDVLAAIHREIRRELDEIRFLRTQQQSGYMGGTRLVLHKQGGGFHIPEKGPSIVELIEQHIDNMEAAKPWCESEYGKLKIAVAKEMLDIVINPYNYLSSHQRMLYSNADAAREEIISNRAGPAPETHASPVAGNHGPTLAQLRADADTETVVRRERPRPNSSS